MSQGEGKWSWSTNDATVGGVLRSVARAHELVVSRRPWDDATQVCAHCVQTVRFQGFVFLDNKVSESWKEEKNTISLKNGLYEMLPSYKS
jgi:hypothetical protein